MDDEYVGATAVLDLLLNLDTYTKYYFQTANNATRPFHPLLQLIGKIWPIIIIISINNLSDLLL